MQELGNEKHIKIKFLGVKITINKNKIFSISDTYVKGRRTVYLLGIKISYKRKKNYLRVIQESASAHKYLDGLRGIEIGSHALEHFWDPIKTLEEWVRVVKPGGYVYMNIPHKDRTFDKDRPVTTLEELTYRHNHPEEKPDAKIDRHHSVWRTDDFLELCKYMNLKIMYYADADDKDGIGFTVIIQK